MLRLAVGALRHGIRMAPEDYRKLCPNSGHVVPQGSGDAAARSALCEACGCVVGVQADPATGRALLFSMHPRGDAPKPLRAAKGPR